MVGLSELADRKPRAALGRPAAARRARARARDEAQGAAARRAARRPRPAAPAAHARRAAQPPAPARADVHPRHAQPGGSALDGRPHRRHERRADPAGRRPAHDRDAARDRARRPVHGRQQHLPRHGRPSASGDRLVVAGRQDVRASVRAPGDDRAVGDDALVSVRAAAVEVGDAGVARRPQLRRVRDRLRRVSRRPREAPPARRRRADAREGLRASTTRRSAGGRATRSGSRGRRRMSSSSAPDPALRPGLASRSTRPRRSSSARRRDGARDAPRSERGGGWVDGASGHCPGFCGSASSCWRRSSSSSSSASGRTSTAPSRASRPTGRLSNYGTIFHSTTYWHNMSAASTRR